MMLKGSIRSAWSRVGGSGRSIKPASEQTEILPEDFDPSFYRIYHADLSGMSDAALAQHYLTYGRHERRLRNPDQLLVELAKSFGQLPWNFDARVYRDLHPDLGIYQSDWQLKEHYLRYGRDEGRPFAADLSSLQAEYAQCLRSGAVEGMSLPTSLEGLMRDHGVRSMHWLTHFKLAEFSILNPGLSPRAPRSRMEGVILFLTKGLRDLAPLSLASRFEPAFYRREHLELSAECRDDLSLYRHWLNVGVSAGHFPNESQAIKAVIGVAEMPTAFDWEVHAARHARDLRPRGTVRLSALEHFLASEDTYETPLRGDDEARASFLEQVAEYHLARRQLDRAKRGFDLAIDHRPAVSRLYHRRADTLVLLERSDEAAEDFAVAAGLPSPSMWSHINAADILSRSRATLEAAVERIIASADWARHDKIWRRIAYAVVDKVMAAAAERASAMYKAGRRDEADAVMSAQLRRIEGLIETIEPWPARLPPAKGRLVVIVANLDLPQCVHYRVEQKRRLLELGGWRVVVLGQWFEQDIDSLLAEASAVIFYRVGAFPRILRAIAMAKALGVPTIYEIDDLLFDPAVYPDPFESFEGQITKQEYADLQYGVPLYRAALQRCDIALASTPALADAMRPLVVRREAYVVRNGLDERYERLLARKRPLPQKTVTIFYGSGTKAHNADFTDLVAPALIRIFDTFEDVRLVVAGFLTIDGSLDPYRSRIVEIGFSPSMDSYLEILATADIAIAPLHRTPMTDCKSEIKWLEAAMLAVPTVVSGTRTYREALVDGETALLADNPAQWYEALEALVIDPALRETIGANARRAALQRYGHRAGLAALRAVLHGASQATADFVRQSLIAPAAPGPASRPVRVLVVNVYFPPQTIGGATRVVVANVDHFLDHHRGSLEIAVAAFDDPHRTGGDPAAKGGLSIGEYRGVPIFRVGVPVDHETYWRAENKRVLAPFEMALDRFEPDVVHFHCIQGLTASVVQAVQDRAIPYLVTLHDAWWLSDHQFLVDEGGTVRIPAADPFDPAIGGARPRIASIARHLILAEHLRKAAARLAVSETFAAYYQRAGFADVRTVANGVPVIASAAWRTAATGKVRLAHIGGRTFHKGAVHIESVLRSTQLPNLSLTIVDHAKPFGACQIETWGASEVRIIGFVPQESIGDLYAQHDVLLAPSTWPESFGLVTREARAAGLWVVTSSLGAIGEDVREGIDGFKVDIDLLDELRAVLTLIDGDVERFTQPPPQPTVPPRTMAEQGEDLARLYLEVAKPDGARAASQLKEHAVDEYDDGDAFMDLFEPMLAFSSHGR